MAFCGVSKTQTSTCSPEQFFSIPKVPAQDPNGCFNSSHHIYIPSKGSDTKEGEGSVTLLKCVCLFFFEIECILSAQSLGHIDA